MNDYEGLNLPQLLDLMHDIVVPDPVSWLPQTAGWLVMTGWLLVVVLLVAYHVHRSWQQKMAIAERHWLR